MAFVSVTCANGQSLDALTRLIQERSKWLKESAEQSVTATLMDVLVSLRALTKVASPKKNEIKLQATSLVPSFTGGREKPTFCLRNGTARYTPSGKVRIGQVAGITSKDFKKCHVWRWDDINGRKWLIVARTQKDALNWAFAKVKKRTTRFKGLAKMALSKLLVKSGSRTGANGTATQNANKVAEQQTKVVKTKMGDMFSVEATDLIDYAKIALKGGQAAIDTAL